jgi:hypothetical protein
MSGKVVVRLGARRQVVRCERLLPVPGEVLVAEGDEVGPEDVIARATLRGLPVAVPVAALLGEDGRDVRERLVRRTGDSVSAGATLAVKKGFLGREAASCVSPIDGTIASLANLPSTGSVVIVPPSRTLEMEAGIRGTVVEALPGRGAVISGPAVFAHGLVMMGASVRGPVRAGCGSASRLLEIDSDCEGWIVFGGRADEAVLELAEKTGALGLIVGSVPAQTWWLLRAGRFAGLTIVVTEAIGDAPMGETTFEELSAVQGRIAWLVPGQQLGEPPTWPEILVSLDDELEYEPNHPRFEIGAQVRIASGRLAGHWGRVANLPGAPQYPTYGRRPPIARVVLADGRRAEVALANLELVG